MMNPTAETSRSELCLIEIEVNEARRSVAVSPTARLLHVLRDELALTGTKSVCDSGNCGACTVLVDGAAVYSCLVLAAECVDVPVTTIESLAPGPALSSLQQAFVDCDGLQCGFCTSGQIMSLEALRRAKGSSATRDDVIEAVTGNLCRCGAYEHIIEAGLIALGNPDGQEERGE